MSTKIFFVSREFADIAEAGGVKDVVNSLACAAKNQGYSVTVFLPFYGSTIKSFLTDEKEIPFVIDIKSADNSYKVSYSTAFYKKVKIVFVHSDIFLQKHSVYTYTSEDEAENSEHIRGTGFEDANILNIVFQKAVLQWCIQFKDVPQVFHCHDAACSLVPFFACTDVYFKKHFISTKFFITIHNAGPGYRHQFYSLNEAAFYTDMKEENFLHGLLNGQVEPFLLSEKYTQFTTVSPWYARELLSSDNKFCPEFSLELINRDVKITGITNGIDWKRYNPEDTAISHLDYSYSPLKGDLKGKFLQRDLFLNNLQNNRIHSAVTKYGNLEINNDCVFYGYHGRLVRQKGIALFIDAAIKSIEQNEDLRFIIIGQGETELENRCIETANKYSGKIVYFNGYEQKLARECVAVSDFLIMPSLFEPCGLEDFIAQFLGTVPIASCTGGLNKIEENVTGFHFSPYNSESLCEKILQLSEVKKHSPETIVTIIQNAVKNNIQNYSWEKVFEKYKNLFFQSQ